MTESKDAWNEVERHFADVGRRLREHYRKLDTEGGPQAADTEQEERRRLSEAVRSLTGQLDQAFTAVGDAMRDPAAQQSLNRAASSFGDALASTFSGVGEEIRRLLRGHREGGEAPRDDG